MASMPDYYAVLGLSPSADQATIHRAWKALLRRFHPDANPGVDVGSRAQAINEAYAVLGKPGPRAAYDRARFAPPPPPRTGMRPGTRPGPHPQPRRRADPHARPAAPKTSQPQRGGAGDKWLPGFFLLLLTAAPVGMIFVLQNEELDLPRAQARAPVAAPAPPPPAPAAEASPDLPAPLPGEAPPLDRTSLDTAIAQGRETVADSGPAAAARRSRRCAAGAAGWAAADFCAAFDEAALLTHTLMRHTPATDPWLAAATERTLQRYVALGLDAPTAFGRADRIRERVTAALLRAPAERRWPALTPPAPAPRPVRPASAR
ncbi:J domain-containing protein [Sphingomonas aracearum]|uniref:J domain-containing protein n=1 Tax=Sphingomonas aracearum TaxID=2283317 RepID=A0A369VUP8_9SPHN|nr:J domain-containing protein [Sphingomonas aracearum]RDE04802.1 J domain-containing protein [Sphingomonas aracearum]